MVRRYPGKVWKIGNGVEQWDKYSIVERVVGERGMAILEALRLYVGEEAFCDGVLLKDGWGYNAIMTGIEAKKLEMVKYMLGINEIREKCMNNMDIFRGIIKILSKKFDISITKYIIESLKIDKENMCLVVCSVYCMYIVWCKYKLFC